MLQSGIDIGGYLVFIEHATTAIRGNQYIDQTRDQLCREPLSRLAEYDKLTRQLINHE